MSGDSGGGMPTQQTITQTSIPDYARPYVDSMLGAGNALTFSTDAKGNPTGLQPYQVYSGDRAAQFTPLQQQSYGLAGAMRPASQLAIGSNLAQQATQGAMQQSYTASQHQNPFEAPGAYQSTDIQAPQIGYSEFGQPQAQQYMSPYMQSVVEMQQRDAQRQADIAGTVQQANATKAGAFGGGRDAIMRAEAERNLAIQKGDIQAKGLQDSYAAAMQQFNADQGRRAVSDQANQATTMDAQKLRESANQFGASQGLQAAQAAAQYGNATQNLNEQSRQYGAGFGLQGLQAALTGANTLGSLGNQQFSQEQGIAQLQNTLGGQQQAQVQSILDQQYQDFLNQQKYPYQQLGYLSDLLRGTSGMATQASQSLYQAPPSMLSQAAGIGTAMYGASMARGGQVSGLADLALAQMQ